MTERNLCFLLFKFHLCNKIHFLSKIKRKLLLKCSNLKKNTSSSSFVSSQTNIFPFYHFIFCSIEWWTISKSPKNEQIEAVEEQTKKSVSSGKLRVKTMWLWFLANNNDSFLLLLFMLLKDASGKCWYHLSFFFCCQVSLFKYNET